MKPRPLPPGHRPCAECRRKRYEEFRAAWDVGQGRRGRDAAHPLPGAEEIDRVLHAERLEAGGVKRAYVAVLSSLPDGTMHRPRRQAAPALERKAPTVELLRLRPQRLPRRPRRRSRIDPPLNRARDPRNRASFPRCTRAPDGADSSHRSIIHK